MLETSRTTKAPPKVQSLFSLSDLAITDGPTEVYIPPPPPPRAFVHRAVYPRDGETTPGNIEFPWYWSRIDHPNLNGNRFAILSVTPLGIFELNGVTANIRQNPTPVGVIYLDWLEHWYIYNLNLSAMAEASFNVVIEERYR